MSDNTGTQALWPQMIAALAAIDDALGLPQDGCNSTAQTLNAISELRAENERTKIMMRNLVQQLDKRNGCSVDAPWHCHEVPGVWDSDNGELAGKPCAWCALWNEAKAMASAIPATANYPHGSLGEAVEK